MEMDVMRVHPVMICGNNDNDMACDFFPTPNQNVVFTLIKADDNEEDTFKIKHPTLGYLNAKNGWGNYITFTTDENNIWKLKKITGSDAWQGILSYKLYSNMDGYKELSVQYRNEEGQVGKGKYFWRMYHDNQKNWTPMQVWLLPKNHAASCDNGEDCFTSHPDNGELVKCDENKNCTTEELGISLSWKYYLATVFLDPYVKKNMYSHEKRNSKLAGFISKNQSSLACNNAEWPGTALSFTIQRYEDGTYSLYSENVGYLLNNSNEGEEVKFSKNYEIDQIKWYFVRNIYKDRDMGDTKHGCHCDKFDDTYYTTFEAWNLYSTKPPNLYVGSPVESSYQDFCTPSTVINSDCDTKEYTIPKFKMYNKLKEDSRIDPVTASCSGMKLTSSNKNSQLLKSEVHVTYVKEFPVPFMIIPVANT